MNDHKTPNPSIRCAVTSCQYNCQGGEWCGLDAIQVGTHEADPTVPECTDCQSFRQR